MEYDSKTIIFIDFYGSYTCYIAKMQKNVLEYYIQGHEKFVLGRLFINN